MTKLFSKDYTRFSAIILLLLLYTGYAGHLQAQCPFTPSFTHPSTYVCVGSNITFTNTTTGTTTGRTWWDNLTNFSTLVSPTRTFTVPGLSVISLIATNGTCTDTAQSAVMVSPLMNMTLTPTNPVCNGGSNGSINLTPGGGTPNRSGNINRGINDYINANTVSNAGYTGGITVEAWVKPRATWTTGDGLFAAFNQTTGTGNRFFVGYNPAAPFTTFVYFDDNVGNQFFTVPCPTGSWYHIAVTISSTNQVSLYLNGTLNRTFATTAGWIPQAGDRFNMGQEWDFAVTSSHFDGWLDEVRVWNAVLSPATVLSNRNSCMGINSGHPNWGNLVAYYSLNEGAGGYVFDRSGRNNHGSRVNGSAYGTAAESNWGCFNDGTGYGYTWSNGATTQDISGLMAGTYTVTLMDGAGAGCNLVQSTTLNNPAAVVVNFTPPGPISICAGASTNITASGANSYVWSPGTGLSSTTTPTVTATPASTQTYTCVGTNSLGCTGTANVQVVVNSLPTATITGPSAICVGQSATLIGGGGVSYVWSNGPTVSNNTVSPTMTTTYTVTATNSFNCTDTETRTVTVNPLPTVSIAGDTTLCLGDTTTITASGGTSYIWNNGPITAANTITPAATTTYTVTVTDGNTCSRSRPVTVTVNPLPVVTISGQDTICLGDTTTITAAGGTGYIWNTGAMTAAVDLSPSSNTNYVVTVTDANTCRNSGNISIVVNALPMLNFSGQDTICDGDTTMIVVGGATSYVWSHGPLVPSVGLSPSISTFYSVIGTDTNGCSAPDSIQIIVNGLPALSITGDDTLCVGDSTMLLGSGANSYLWSNGDLTALTTVTPALSTTYVLTGTDLNGCSNSTSISVTVHALPITTITGADSVCVGDSVTLTANGGLTYFWDIFSANQSIMVAPTVNTTYTVTATDANGCQASASHSVAVNALPATPTINQSANTMSTSTGYASYQWYFNGNLISGANSNFYTGTQSGNYTVVVTNGSGCMAESAPYSFIFVGISPAFAGLGLEVYPNPNSGQFVVRLALERDRNVGVAIFDLMGKQVWSHTGELPVGEWKQEVDLSGFARGTYLLQVVSEGQKVTRKVVVH